MYKAPGAVEFIETESEMVVSRAWGKRAGTVVFSWYVISDLQHKKKVLGMEGGKCGATVNVHIVT